jgi:hypothetical protein
MRRLTSALRPCATRDLGRFSARASSSSRGDAVLLQYPKDKHAFDPVTGVFKLLHP